MSSKCDVSKPNWYHVVIIGGGPAAISAAIYTHRFDLKTLIIGEEYGGAISKTYLIENYPGFFDVSGFELMEAFQKHYEHFNIPYKFETVTKIEKDPNDTFIVSVSGGETYHACAVIVATGGKYRKLNVPGEEEFHGRGVSYCATCDGFFFRDKTVIVVGGSDSAAVEALFLSKFAKKVYIVYRRAKIRAEPINAQRCDEEEKIEIIPNTTIKRIIGKDKVESVEFNDGTIFPTDAVFIEIGQDPQSELVKDLGVKLNDRGEIIVDSFAQTNVPGIFAAGDVTNIREKQVITAAGQAVSAAYSVRDYLEKLTLPTK
ncbi:MAG: thioredoxin-disulfide reductase [Promethearchaeia archaeon]|nr:MAG: thioredoxin-disulfide reductase [Candidatus Lokiarchaeia archaeon]